MIRVDRPRSIATGALQVDRLELGDIPCRRCPRGDRACMPPNLVRQLIRFDRLPDGGGYRLILGDPKAGEWERLHGAWEEQRQVAVNGIAYAVTHAVRSGSRVTGQRVVMTLQRAAEESPCPKS